MIRALLLGFSLIVLLGCQQQFEEKWEPPERVYVPAEGYKLVVTVSAQTEATVGEWVELNATRTAGPWKSVRFVDLPEGSNDWIAGGPYEAEQEVAANLSWEVEPSGFAQFDLPTVLTAQSMERSVKFDAPGKYRLRGHTSVPTGGWSNWIEIEVR